MMGLSHLESSPDPNHHRKHSRQEHRCLCWLTTDSTLVPSLVSPRLKFLGIKSPPTTALPLSHQEHLCLRWLTTDSTLIPSLVSPRLKILGIESPPTTALPLLMSIPLIYRPRMIHYFPSITIIPTSSTLSSHGSTITVRSQSSSMTLSEPVLSPSLMTSFGISSNVTIKEMLFTDIPSMIFPTSGDLEFWTALSPTGGLLPIPGSPTLKPTKSLSKDSPI